LKLFLGVSIFQKGEYMNTKSIDQPQNSTLSFSQFKRNGRLPYLLTALLLFGSLLLFACGSSSGGCSNGADCGKLVGTSWKASGATAVTTMNSDATYTSKDTSSTSCPNVGGAWSYTHDSTYRGLLTLTESAINGCAADIRGVPLTYSAVLDTTASPNTLALSYYLGGVHTTTQSTVLNMFKGNYSSTVADAYYYNNGGFQYTLTLNATGTFAVTSSSGGTANQTGTWVDNGNNSAGITVTGGSGDTNFTLVTNGTLALTTSQTFTLNKQ
jgi:hypothetical protein